MLEILALIALTKKVGAICEAKGRKAGGYKALTVFLWFGGEILGAVIYAVATGGEGGFGVYFAALVGAAIGASLAFSIANNLEPARQELLSESPQKA